MTPEQLKVLKWVLIEACDLHVERDLTPSDYEHERADLCCLVDYLEAQGVSMDELKWMKQ